MSRPSPIRVGPLRCRVLRGPRRGATDEWYWRIWFREEYIWAGWDTERGITIRAAEFVAEDNFVPAREGRPRTVGELLKVWAAHYRKRQDIAAGTLAIKKRNLRHLLKHFDPILLTELGHDDIDRYRDARLTEGDGPSTIEVEHRTLAQAWRWGRKRSFCSGDPPRLTIQMYTVYNHRTPTDEEIDSVLGKLRERATRRSNGAEWPRMFLLLMRDTGARLKEVGTLTWSRVDLTSAPPRVTLLGKRTGRNRQKDHQPRTIPISPTLADELRLWALRVGNRSPDAPVLGVGHKTCRSRGIWHIKEACEELGIEPFTNHGVRRRAIRRFRKRGVHVKEAAAYFGHSEVVMLRMYDEVEPGDLEAAIAKVYGS